VKVSTDGRPLPVAFPLARPGQGGKVEGRAIGMSGFPGYTQCGWPDAGKAPNMTYMFGVVTARHPCLTSSSLSGGPSWLIQHTTPSWRGNSGSPLFLEDGTVIGVYHAAGQMQENGVSSLTSSGILVDAVWDLLGMARGIEGILNPERDGREFPDNPVPDRSMQTPFAPPADAQERIAEARASRRRDDPDTAFHTATKLIEAYPWWWEPYAERAKALHELHELSHASQVRSPLSCLDYENKRWQDAVMAWRLNPTDPECPLEVGYALCGLSGAQRNPARAHMARYYAEWHTTFPSRELEAKTHALRA
jgi:hypothetical protein